MGNRVGIGLHFVRGMDFWVGIRFIRPLAWPSVGRIQYAPTLTDKILSVFSPIRPLAWPSVGRIQYAPTLTDEILSIFSPIRPLAWPSVGRIQYAPTLTDEILSIFLSIRPLAWPFVGRIQYAPTLTDEILSIFLPIRPLTWPPVGRMLLRPTRIIKNRLGIGFVFRGVAEKGAGRGLCEKWGRRASIIIRRLLPLRARRRMGPIIAPAHAFIIPNYVA